MTIVLLPIQIILSGAAAHGADDATRLLPGTVVAAFPGCAEPRGSCRLRHFHSYLAVLAVIYPIGWREAQDVLAMKFRTDVSSETGEIF